MESTGDVTQKTPQTQLCIQAVKQEILHAIYWMSTK